MVAIFVILTIIAFVAVDSVIQWGEAKAKKKATEPLHVGSMAPVFALESVSMPEGLFLAPSHTWVKLETSGKTHVGLDDFVQRAIGRIDHVELPKIGQSVRRGDKLFAIGQGERTAVFTAPMDGVVTSVNEQLAHHPDAVKADPYSQGWVCALEPKGLAQTIKRLRIAEEARTWLNREVERFQAFISLRPVESMALGRVLQDGGQLTDGVLELMDEETWQSFTTQFLQAGEAED
jgi:glycine cleavage system H protein